MNLFRPKVSKAPQSLSNLALILLLAKHALSEDVCATWSCFMSKHEESFKPVEEKDEGEKEKGHEEYCLEWTTIHRAFEEMVELSVAEFLESCGKTMEIFSDYLNEERDGNGGEEERQAEAFAELVVGIVDFRAFVDIMKDRAKREYYYSILAMWRKSLK